MKMKNEPLKNILEKLEKIEALVNGREISDTTKKYIPSVANIMEEYENSLAAAYKAKSTTRDYLGHAQKLMGFLNGQDLKLNLLEIRHLERYLAVNRKDKKINTYIKSINALRRFLNYLCQKGYISKDLSDYLNKLKLPKKTKPIRRSLYDLDLKRIDNYLKIKEYEVNPSC